MKIEEVKRNLNKMVRYKDSKNNIDNDYMLTGCIIRRDSKKGFYYQVELQEKDTRSIVIASLEDVHAIE